MGFAELWKLRSEASALQKGARNPSGNQAQQCNGHGQRDTSVRQFKRLTSPQVRLQLKCHTEQVGLSWPASCTYYLDMATFDWRGRIDRLRAQWELARAEHPILVRNVIIAVVFATAVAAGSSLWFVAS